MSRTPKKKEMIATVRCAVYTRKSTEEGLEQEFNTLDAQRQSGEAYIASQKNEGWQCLPEHYDDGGFSGGNMDRPALERLLADIKAGKVDCVVVYKVDRLSRSLLDFAKIMEVFDHQHVAFVSVTQQFNTSTPMGRLADRLMAEVSDGQVRFRLVWHVFLRSEVALVDKGCRLLENAASSHREPAVFALPELALLPGVGDRVHKLIAWAFGQSAVEGCGCGAWIDQMNAWGPAGCRENLDKIVDHLIDVATKRNWTLGTAGAGDGEPVPRILRLRLARLVARGIVRAPLGECVLRKICREGVLLAIMQAEAANHTPQPGK